MDSARTRERLLDAAERLFATHGIHAVSLRAINVAAGARNVSAAHYHFGSKDGVIRALVARRMEAVAGERLAALGAVEAGAGTDAPELRAVIEAMVLPFLRLLADGGADYVTFLARVTGEPGIVLDELAPPAFWVMIQRLAALLQRILPHLPERVLLLRVRFLFQQTFIAVTELDRLTHRGQARLDRHDVEAIGADLVDYLAGGLAAPSRATPAVRPAPSIPAPGRRAARPRAAGGPFPRLRRATKEVPMRCLAFLLPVLAVAAAAHGATTCLTGDATLGDQRALATLQGQIDATCPCASFTGGPGHARKDYRSCAKPLVDAAVASSALRGDCKRTVLTDVRTSTCGTTLVACGRVQPSARTPVTCHVKAADRCHDRSNAQETACTAETRCGDVVTWTAGTCLDGRDPGPASPGAIHVTYTKPSVTNPAATRTLDTVIWYPTTVTGPLDPQTAAVLDAPVDPTGGPFPVLVFSHGLCGFPAQSTFLTALLATRRYLVIAPSHPGSTIYDCAGGTEDLVTSALERPSEATYVLDQLVAAGQDPGSPFYGLVDTTRLGMSGHSFGGQTAYKLSTDPRFRAVALLAPAVPLMNPPVVPIPSLAMFGDDDTFVPLQPIRDRFAAAAAPKFLVDIAHTGHFAFSNGCLGTQPDCAYPAEMSQPEAHAVVLRWVVPFLEVYLRGGSRLDALLTPPVPPGVTLQAVR